MISDFGLRISEWKKKASQIRNPKSEIPKGRLNDFGFRNEVKSEIPNPQSEIPRGRLYFCQNVENPSAIL